MSEQKKATKKKAPAKKVNGLEFGDGLAKTLKTMTAVQLRAAIDKELAGKPRPTMFNKLLARLKAQTAFELERDLTSRFAKRLAR